MPADAKATLVGLRDIRGVEGSFLLLLPEGRVVTRESMPMLSDDSLTETGRRLSNVFGALGSACPAADELLLRFDGMSLFTRRGTHVLLGVLATDTASLPALRMASNLVLRQLDTVELANTLPPAPAPLDAAHPAVKPAPRFWRGTAVGDGT
jgi:hypothetical protein